MARLQVINRGPVMMCVVSSVPMPDGTRRMYMETGRNAIAHIYERILLDKRFIRSQARVISRRLEARCKM